MIRSATFYRTVVKIKQDFMGRETIKVSLTEFMNFVNKPGMANVTVVSNSKNKREEEQYKDYWLQFR